MKNKTSKIYFEDVFMIIIVIVVIAVGLYLESVFK